MQTRRSILLSAASAPLLKAAAQTLRIRRVDIFHHSHTDVGYTDLPSVCREMQARFLDVALEACLKDARFRWTAEVLLTVDDWWSAASPERHRELISVVRRGQMDIMALPFNQAPFLDAREWRQAFQWVPESLWKELRPEAAMQNDVNGFPRAGAIGLLDRGIRHLLMGINADSGGPPFRRPSAFWWKMPDGRRMFVWLGDHYGTAHGFFEPKGWIRGQPKGAETAHRPPRAGDFLRTDAESLRAAHGHFVERLRRLEAEGYDFERLILSYTNQWRYDNDPPFPPLADFVEAWNRLGLEPPLRLTTATQAVREIEREVGERIPVREGEWTDWWANGDASGPREVAASRVAKRHLSAALAPVWGEPTESARRKVEEILRDLCLFDEHTWGANVSISRPDSLDTIGQYAEKSLLAYRPMAQAEWLLAQRARTRLDAEPDGLYIVNTAPAPFSGWASFPLNALREEYRSAEEPGGGRSLALWKDTKNGRARIWVQDAPPASVLRLRLSPREVQPPGAPPRLLIETDGSGWPVAATWPGMRRPLFSAGTGDFVSVEVVPPADRRTITDIHRTADTAKRDAMRQKALKEIRATYRPATVEETPHTMVFSQVFDHPRLARAMRQLEVWKAEPRARLTMRFDRLSSVAPEVFYINFASPVEGVMPRFSNGGVPFVPYRDQLAGSCRDYCAIDGWAHYQTEDGHWLWVSRDAPLVTVGGPHTLARRTTEPSDPHRLMAMIFDNFWHTNFVANSHGEMEFQFDLVWRRELAGAAALAETLVAEPVVLINPAARESPALADKLFRP